MFHARAKSRVLFYAQRNSSETLQNSPERANPPAAVLSCGGQSGVTRTEESEGGAVRGSDAWASD